MALGELGVALINWVVWNWINKSIVEKSVSQHLYSHHGINWVLRLACSQRVDCVPTQGRRPWVDDLGVGY